ncbi:VPS8-like protein [Mya arenaria]|uniref:VPS8-like protein n=1 Tax=Mya arenaria TaxID=6604 RepID=A0ABY7EKS4_MYAAR|nr:VPS8-like protein [Mya arenaria]
MPTAMAVSSLIAIGTSHGLVLVFDYEQVLKWCLGSTAVGAQYGAVSSLSFNKDCTRLLSGFARGQITMWDLSNGKLIRTITDAHPPGTAVLHIKFTDSLVLAVCSDSGGSVFELEFKRLIAKDHPMQDVSILAMASLSKVLLVTLSPQLKVVFTHPLKGSPSCLPLLAWQFVVIQVSQSDRVVDPVLVFARESTIHFHQVVCRSAQDIKCTGLQKMTVPYKLLNWMNTRTLVTIDTTEKIHVIDVRSEEELQVLDMTDVQLVYNTSFFKSLATGGNVSQALAFAGDHACYQTLASHENRLFVLGSKAVHVFTVRNWKERIDVLVQEQKYQDALALALSFYENKAKAIVGLSGPSQKKKEIVADLMLDLLFEYNIVPVCVEYCLHLNKMDILFGRIYERFSMDMIAMGTFLECLEPYILDDRLRVMPPVVMKDFVTHYEARSMLESVEACIVHMDVSSLDIHHVVHLCWSHGLYDAILYVYNKGMFDYTTPLEELLSTLKAAVDTGKQLSDQQIRLGNKLLVFSSLTCRHTKAKPADELEFPYLRTLLVFDTREFLNVLALRQHIVDILLRIMVESVGFTVLEFLCNPDDESRHEERQQALLELSHAGGLKQVDEESYRVCELLYEKRREFDRILSCYLRDYARKELVSIDSKQAAQMVFNNLAVSLADVVKQLKSEETVLFEFLQGASIFELYIDLMCKFRPNDVYNFIKPNEGYRLEQTLAILSGKLKKLTENLLGSSDGNKDMSCQFNEAEAVLLVIIQLCQRNSNKMDEQTRESLWFPLLDALMFPQRRIKDIDNKEILNDFKKLTHHVLNNMMGYIALPAILQKIMQDPAYNTGKFGEIRELILGMLETYNYEQTLMITCKNLLNHDIHMHLRNLTSVAAKGYIPRGEQCRICVKRFINQQDSDTVIVFRCGHSYHSNCLQAVGSVHVIDGEDTYSSEDPQHIQNVDAVRRSMRTPSRLGMLSELSKPESSSRTSRSPASSIFQQDRFKLNVGAPRVFD